ncbi:hypothetical protein MMC09_000729 [Bachmanniomyces sp. S44760]|nr:hypothetical protein [Bachmanniomyces sp. S44760]
MHQTFKIWLIPFYNCPVSLTTVLQLIESPSPPPSSDPSSQPPPPTLYHIKSQNDLYQTTEFFKFFSVFRIAWLGLVVWQFLATGFCVLGALLGGPVSWVEENAVGGNKERGFKEVVLG